MNNNKKIACVVGVCLPFLFTWEYVCRKSGSEVKPSVALSQVATWTYDTFYRVGDLFARISSFYTYIDFEDLIGTVNDLFKPVVDILFSPWAMIKGYLTVARDECYNNPYLVVLGSITLVSLIAMAYYYRKQRMLIQ